MMPGFPEKILLVDDEANLLAGMRRLLGQSFNITTAEGGIEALGLAQNEGPFAVVVSDMRMPGMDGIELMRRFQEASPDTTRIMLTGNADQKTAVEAINTGQIFRFFNKPCSMATLSEGIMAGIRQYRLINGERVLLEGTLSGSIALMGDVLSMVAPESFQRSLRLRGWSLQVAAGMGLDSAWELELAASLARIGEISVPLEVLARSRSGQRLTPVEEEMLSRVPEAGANLVRKIPRMAPVADAILHQDKWFNGQGLPHDGKAGQDIPLNARVLHVLLALDEAGSGELSRNAFAALEKMQGRFDPAVLTAAARSLSAMTVDEAAFTRLDVPGSALRPGDHLETSLELDNGKLVLAAGQTITDALFVRLQNLHKMYKFRDPVRIRRAGRL
ncbi:Hydrogenase transcriptional regulatory protein HoxA [Paramagnetospirillum magnetotacticum MS-1]|uniref:Hydrogenase transcriptional regulatory protein HoxA n=1 Tax=Paramagnetospirillum magnetotacticum MS-1 TaxID=272627 RepID=A0A0C2UWF8_PARME|nr:HD domain-containing phosphohydrolase [Paramagnetospirillum magnetotacticum]KIL97131.1 Hydrogenase transcriptional regulatory protein HoxA [Paramagnetospirillum magnetotacticum MS-1]